MIIPIGHEDTMLRRVPWVSFGIMIACALVLIAVEWFGPETPDPDPARSWGLVPTRITLVTLFTHLFMHAGLFHLLGNLMILYLAGPAIEDVWGRPLFAAFYLAAGIAASLLFAIRYADLDVPLVGASGAISGVMGAFLVRYARTKIRFAYVFGLRIRGTFEAPALVMLPLWLAEQILGALLADMGALHGVAYLAHVGGFAFGAAVAFAFRKLDIEARYVHPAIESKITTVHVERPALEKALAARAGGDPAAAFAMLLAEAARAPEERDVAIALWDVAGEIGRAQEAAPRMAGVIRQEVRSGETLMAADHWIELESRVPGAALEPRILVALAQALTQAGRRRDARQAIEAAMGEAVRAEGAALEPAAAFKLARIAMTVSDDLGRRAAALVLARRDVSPELRREAEALVAAASHVPVEPVG